MSGTNKSSGKPSDASPLIDGKVEETKDPFKPLPVTVNVVTDDVGKQALEAANAAGIKSPEQISGTETALSPGNVSNRLEMLESFHTDLHGRLSELEALVKHIYDTVLRTANVEDILNTHRENIDGETVGEVLDPSARGRIDPARTVVNDGGRWVRRG